MSRSLWHDPSQEHTAFEATNLRAAGDTVLVDLIQHGKGKQSGLTGDLPFFMLFTFRGRKLVRMESVMDEAEALKAVGLSE